MKVIQVVAAIIVGPEQRTFITRRPDHLHQGGLWEFPGGKLEASENPEQALTRELFEEIDIQVTHAQPYMRVDHDYGDKKVVLDIWQVDGFSGNAHGKEGQQCRWVDLHSLTARSADQDLDFPAANQPILERLAEQGLNPQMMSTNKIAD